jgi:tetratricopeptide (TPR) repeat protein
MKKIFCICLFLLFLIVDLAYGQTLFDSGLKDFKDENYEEALQSLIKARKLEPTSTVIAFYLGLTYKKMDNYKDAVPYLRDAVTLTPPIREALIELIDALYQTENFDEAQKWTNVAEKEGVSLARVQFLKGLILSKKDKYDDAIAAFEKAKEMDKSIAQAAEFQIANIYLKEGKLKDSQKRFKMAMTLDPTTDTATFARNYEKFIAEKMEKERPLRITVGLTYKYDTNVSARPTSGFLVDDPSISPTVAGERDFGMNLNTRIMYTAPFSFKKPYNLSFQYSLYADRFFRRDDYNQVQQTFAVMPGYGFDRVSFSIPSVFGYSWLQGSHGTDFLNSLQWFEDTKYMRFVNLNPTMRFMVSQNNIMEMSTGYTKKYYYNASLTSDEDRDGKNFNGALGWMFFFKDGNALLSGRFTYTDEDTSGSNWAYREQKFSISFIYPLSEKFKFQLSSEAAFTKYKFENLTFNMTRRDDTYIGAIGLIYALFKNTDLIAQYNYTRDKSNIGIYDYEREVFSIGMEYRY